MRLCNISIIAIRRRHCSSVAVAWCIFAVDEDEAYFCTHLQGTASQFMPFNRGLDDGAGNPPNPDGRKTDYLWREVLERTNFVDILENYTQVVEEKDKRKMVWPRYHQF